MIDIDYIYGKLKEKIDQENILKNVEMKKYTSFKIGGIADILVRAKDMQQIKEVINISKQDNIPLFILGNGTNILVKDNGIRGIVLKIELDNIEINENDSNVEITVGSGMKIMQLSQILVQNSIQGFEFASGIPGTIGGAIKMNAGAHGGEMKDIVVNTTYIDLNGEIKTINNEEHKFGYRNSIFSKCRVIILGTKLKFSIRK